MMTMIEKNPYVKTLEILKEKGWTKYNFTDGEGHVCLYGAYFNATEGWSRTHRDKLMDRVAGELFPSRTYSSSANAADINDHRDTTQEDVELILKHCIGKWEIEHPIQ